MPGHSLTQTWYFLLRRPVCSAVSHSWDDWTPGETQPLSDSGKDQSHAVPSVLLLVLFLVFLFFLTPRTQKFLALSMLPPPPPACPLHLKTSSSWRRDHRTNCSCFWKVATLHLLTLTLSLDISLSPLSALKQQCILRTLYLMCYHCLSCPLDDVCPAWNSSKQLQPEWSQTQTQVSVISWRSWAAALQQDACRFFWHTSETHWTQLIPKNKTTLYTAASCVWAAAPTIKSEDFRKNTNKQSTSRVEMT